MKKYLLGTAILLSLNSPIYASSYPSNIEGTYDCSCTEVDSNAHYKGEMTLKKTGQTYSLKSTFNDGSTYLGTGIYNPSKHSFSLAFINPAKSEETGVAIADVKSDYAMTSTWTYLNKTNVAHGECTKRKSEA